VTKKPVCVVCGQPIPRDRIELAASRGTEAIYDSDSCRNTAAKRRYRARKKGA